MEQEEKRVSLEELRSLSDVERTKGYEILSRNGIPPNKIGKLHGIRRSDAERWRDSRSDVLGGCL
jgi:hypothetical protein